MGRVGKLERGLLRVAHQRFRMDAGRDVERNGGILFSGAAKGVTLSPKEVAQHKEYVGRTLREAAHVPAWKLYAIMMCDHNEFSHDSDFLHVD